MKYKIILIIFYLSVCEFTFSQNNKIVEYELKINKIFDKIKLSTSDENKISYNEAITSLMKSALAEASSFEAAFDSVKHIGKIKASDSKICLYSWIVPLKEHSIYSVIFQKSNGSIYLLQQTDNDDKLDENKIYSDSWYGALYYSIVPFKIKKSTYYALLGWRNLKSVQQKTIDIIDFNNEIPVFGMPIFEERQYDDFLQETNIIKRHRVVFEFDKRVNMYLEYNHIKKQFEFDNLSPMEVVNGKILSYGPDFSVNAYRYKKGIWFFVEDIKVRNK